MAYTQLSLIATPGKRYSFAAKSSVGELVYGFKYNPFTGELDLYFKDLPEQTLVGRLTGGSIAALTPTLIRTLLNVEDGADVTGSNTPQAHNLIDTTGHSVAGLTIGHFLKATGAAAYAFGAHGLAYGDVGAEQAGISVLESDFNATTFMYALANNTPLPKTPAEVIAILSSHAAAAFDFNSQNLTGVGTIGCGAITSSGDMDINANAKFGNTVYEIFVGLSAGAPTSEALYLLANGQNGIVRTYYDDSSLTLQAGISADYESRIILNGRTGLDNIAFYLHGSNYMTIDGATGNVDIIKHNASTVGLKLGGTLITKTAAQINGLAPLASPNFTGTPLAPDHGVAAMDMLVNVCYGTGSPPTANTTTIGALFIKYVA